MCEWKNISQEAISLIKRLLVYNPAERISAAEALLDPWIVKNASNKLEANREIVACLENMKTFRIISSMQIAVLFYMAGHILTKEEESKIRKNFKLLDTNGDGELSEEDLMKGYMLLSGGDTNQVKEEVRSTIKNLDINKNGVIDYNGNNFVKRY